MFSSLKQRLLLGLYVFILVSIPVGAYLASQYQSIKSSAKENSTQNIPKQTPKATVSPAKELLSASESNLSKSVKPSPSPTPSVEDSSPTVASSFGPTLSLKVSLQGRPPEDQSTRLFVGIMEGNLSANPKFLLSFSIDLPKTGEYANLSLAGLTSGNTYSAILKGSAQIATASAFMMSPTVSKLNSGEIINLLSGDLNEDNIINTADYSIVKQALNSTSASINWNANADLNKDGVVNLFDLLIISKNMNKTGATGAWTSPIPSSAPIQSGSASSSASLSPEKPIGGYQQAVTSSYQQAVTSGYQDDTSSGGYWMWIPK